MNGFKDLKLSTKYIIIVLFVVHLLPIWIFKFIPTQDGINHVYNAYVLKDYHKPENYKLQEVFKLNLKFFPNWTSHAFMALLMYIFPPLICEKILLSLCIILLPISLFYFLDAVDKGKVTFGLLGFIYAYGFPLHMGFYNFVLSMSLFFLTLGYWWKNKDAMRLINVLILYMLLLWTYLCHYLSYFLVVLSLSFFTIFLCICSKKLKPFLLFFMLPAYFIMLSYYLDSIRGYARGYKDFDELVQYFFNMGSIISFPGDHLLIGRILLCFFIVVFLLALWYRIKEIYKLCWGTESSHINLAARRKQLWTKIINGKEQFLLIAVILTVIYFKAPWQIGSGGWWINERIHIYIFLVLLPFLNVDFHKHIRGAITVIIITLSFWFLSSNVYTYYYLNKDIAEMTSSASMLKEHSTFTVYPDEWGGESDYLGEMEYVNPFLHLPSYFCLKKDVVYLQNYEALFNYFPINFKDKRHYFSKEADYLLVWWPEYGGVEVLEDNYVLVHSGKYNQLYRRKKTPQL